MTTRDNRTLVSRFFEEVFNRQDAGAAADILAPDFVAHHPAFPGGIRGVEGIMGTTGMFRAGFSDLNYRPDDFVVEGDKVAVRWTAHGTHDGTFFNVPPSGRTVTVTGIDIFRASDGKLAEAWVNSDLLGLMQQIGAVPSPGGGG